MKIIKQKKDANIGLRRKGQLLLGCFFKDGLILSLLIIHKRNYLRVYDD
jgi:hypothetical protein